MGSACCVAAREPITKGSPSEALQRHARRSPSWSFRWDNRGRVAGEEPSEDWVHDGGGGSHPLDAKSGATVEIASASEGGIQLDSSQSLVWQKSPVLEENTGILRHPSSDPSISWSSAEMKESTESPAVLYPSPAKLSTSAPSALSLTTSSLSSKIHHLPPHSTPSRLRCRSPGHQLLRHVSDSGIPECKLPAFSISEEASSLLLPTQGSNDGSSNNCSSPAFSELTRTRRERWSFDSQQLSGSTSLNLQTCGICSKLLIERSSWGGQKLIVTTEIDVVAVLICGHVFHAECLEFMTAETNKYDPKCPVCALGEKISGKALKAEMDLKARKQSRNWVVDSNLIEFDHDKSSGHDGTNPKISSSLGNRFLRRRFSIGSKEIRSFSENHTTRKKGFFWTKSSKE
ncbi:Zinc finger, RING FYVE PHD-type [Olea europaea subsp. europaea]|uniref:Zinc finger, RING FYVE PHD-type n=2 Tax=Olea europaea subsp. europaea TaxID=158383 RepID=A0A8S0QEQ8_OLEEU|nr:Zinc finger, RING FYVE PHD-type [Olea europaea subsp. europaea]